MTTSLNTALAHLSAADPVLAEIIANTTERPTFTPHTNYYQAIVDSIVSQQLSVKAAATIQKRFNSLFGDENTTPTPSQILTKDVEEYRAIGLSRPKAGYILDLAYKVADNIVVFDHLETLSNEEIIADLTQIKGVGEWTVHMFLMFCMGRLDVLPVGDLGIQNGVRMNYGLSEKPLPKEVAAIAAANNWHPYESVASWFMWHSLDNKPAL